MLHSPDEFLNAIEAEPADRTRRLVFADWLDEHDDPRGELIRTEEEVRELPAFSDRFWELKPRRNELREKVGREWCGRMRYGTECEPVFRHGIPDGWRERWRLIREFTERWHRIPMGDVGGRQAEIAEAETRLDSGSYFGSISRFRPAETGRKLPPSVREWVAFMHDVLEAEDLNIDPSINWLGAEAAEVVPGYAAVSLWCQRDPEDGRIGDTRYAVRFPAFHQPDPPVYAYHQGFNNDYEAEITTSDTPSADSVSEFALDHVLSYTRGVGGFVTVGKQVADLRQNIRREFPVQVQFGENEWSEADNILVRLEPLRWRSDTFHLIVRVAKPLPRERIPEFLWDYARRGYLRGIFATQ